MLNLIMKDVLGTPAILVGLFALLGLALQRKGLTEVVSGTLKTIMGFIILGVGANVLVGTLNSFGAMFEHAFHIKGIIPNNEVVVAIAQKAFGKTTAMIMLLGMLVNILIARFTRFKYIFLTGHHTMYMACMLAVILATFGIGEIQTILIGAVILGVVMALFLMILHWGTLIQ
jgi:PTS system ascorbate-specific IIC component